MSTEALAADVLLMRHGEAQALAATDASRRLTRAGEEDARRAGAWLAGLSLDVQLVLCSPYRRARDTALMVQRSLPGVPLTQLDCLMPDAHPRALQRILDGYSGGVVLCVGHQPLLGYALQWLVEGTVGAGYPFATAALALLRREFPGPGGGVLSWYRRSGEYDLR